ncbi:MAG: ABC transporter substrate-binding protein [Actinobacteria bacterium]|nr:ABC transporter substrate-binding protein [Actinomycetota bacterium]
MRLFGLLVALIVLAAACGGDDPSSEDSTDTTDEVSDEPILIGASLPLSGDFSEPGKGVQNGYEVWKEHVNASGGLLGRPVELVIRDDASDPNTVVADYERLITVDQVDLLFGPFSSFLTIPSSEVAEKYEMVFVEPAGSAPDVFNRGLQYLFYASTAVAQDQGNYWAEWVVSLPEGERPTTAAYPIVDDPFAGAAADGIREILEAGGIETVYREIYPPEQTNFGPIAAKIADSEAEIVVGGTIFEDAVGLVRSMQELDYQPKAVFLNTAPATTPGFKDALGDAVEGIYGPSSWASSLTTPGNAEFVETYTEMFGSEPAEDAAQGYTTGQVMAAAVEAVGSTDDQDAIRDYLRANSFETIEGTLSFDDTGAPSGGGYIILQYQDGEIVYLLPEDVATGTPVYPKPEW